MAEIYIKTARLILRQWTAADHEPYIQLNQDADVMEFFPSILSPEETLTQINRLSSHIVAYGYGFFALERKDNNRFIGFTGLSHPRFDSYFTPCVEIGWRLSKASWGRGFATEAAKACLEYGFKILNLEEIYSFTSIHNIRSEQVMKKIGMEKAGTFDHPSIKDGNVLKTHVLYRISK